MIWLSRSHCTFSITLTKHDFKLFRQSESRDADVLIERRIIVTEYFINSFRFDLKFKMNMKFSASWQSSIISKVALSTWESAWEQKSVSIYQCMHSEKSVSVYNNSLSASAYWAEQISILSWLWLHVWSAQLY